MLFKVWDFGGNSGDEFLVLVIINVMGINVIVGDVWCGGGFNMGGMFIWVNIFIVWNWDGFDLVIVRGVVDYYKIIICFSNGNCMIFIELKFYLGIFMGVFIFNVVVYSDVGGDNFIILLAFFFVFGVG